MERPRPQDRVIVVVRSEEDAPEFIIAFERETDGFHVYVAYTPEQAMEILNEHSSWMLQSNLQMYEQLHTLFSHSPAYGEYARNAPAAIHIGKDVAMRLAVALGIYSKQRIIIGEPLRYKIHDSIAWALIPEDEQSDGIAVVAGAQEGIYRIYFVYSREQFRALVEENRDTVYDGLYRGLCEAAEQASLPESSHHETKVLAGPNAALIAESYIYVTQYFQARRRRQSDPDSGIFSRN